MGKHDIDRQRFFILSEHRAATSTTAVVRYMNFFADTTLATLTTDLGSQSTRRDAMKLLAIFAFAVLVEAALAQHQTFVVNPDSSEVKMTLKTTHELVNGTFHIQSGSIEFDRSAPKMSGTVVVLAGSGKTGNDSRDKKMSKDILKVDQHTTV